MQKTLIKSLLLIIAFTFALSANYIFAVWTGPTQAPPGGNTPTPIHIGVTDQVKNAGLALNSLAVFGNGFFQGNVEMEGKIKIGNNATAPEAGAIRFTGTDFEGYTGTEWKSLTASSVTTQAGFPFYGTNNESESIARKEECKTNGGTVVSYRDGGVDYSFCKFEASLCQSGWTKYENLTSTSNRDCKQAITDNNCYSRCSTGSHTFNNIPTETCGYYDKARWGGGRGGSCEYSQPVTCSANLIEVGCY